jgi:hypothetical protein
MLSPRVTCPQAAAVKSGLRSPKPYGARSSTPFVRVKDGRNDYSICATSGTSPDEIDVRSF